MMQNMRNWFNSRVAAGVLWLGVVGVSRAAGDPKGKGEEKPAQGQQLCPSTPAGPYQVNIDCPPIKAPGKTVCQATIDYPPAKEPDKKAKKQPKSK